MTLYRRPSEIGGPLADMALEAPFILQSSLYNWGLLPLESHTRTRIAEHDPRSYDSKYAELFSEGALFRHQIYMLNVLEAYGKRYVRKYYEHLVSLRRDAFPQGALDVAELGRFNIPEGSPPSTRVQLYYGLTLLLRQRPIKTLYILAPRPDDPNRPLASRPQMEVFFSAPGFDWLRHAAEEVIAQDYPVEPFETTIKHEPLRDLYESLGFEVTKTIHHVFGLPNGAHIMRAPTHVFLSKIIDYSLAHAQYLTADQKATLTQIRREIAP